jgi:uracil-DNA glycosylase family 4
MAFFTFQHTLTPPALPHIISSRKINDDYCMNPEKIAYLNALGIQPWQLKNQPTLSACSSNSSDWEPLQQAVKACIACNLHQTRTQVVFGVGNQNADLMFIGEAPGFHEDKQGEPFVGRAGQLLNAMLEAIDMERPAVYIANILKCRPPENRDPTAEEVSLCTSFLEKQIALVQPKLLVALGRIAAHFLLNTKTSLTQLRGQTHTYANTPLIITYHPAYLLRNPADKSKAFQDLQLIQKMLLA